MKSKSVGIVGTGPSALMAGTVLVENGCKVVFFDQKKSAGRKFLVAGNGGFNLTNNDEINEFVSHYDSELIENSVRTFNNIDFRKFLDKIGIETFVGSSGKIFPMKGIKPIEVLKCWQKYLTDLSAEFKMEQKLIDFNSDELIFENKGIKNAFQFDNFIFALGGGSWSITGSDGKWLKLFQEKEIICKDFKSSNSGFELKNHENLKTYAGQTIKNCKVYSTDMEKLGEVVITEYGIEGTPIYAMNKKYRDGSLVYIDFKPALTIETLEIKLQSAKNNSEGLRDLKLSKVAIAWIKLILNKEQFQNIKVLAQTIKKFELEISNLRPIDEVISTTGGIGMNDIQTTFQLKKFPNAYCVGEMLDWDAPTGGYLIQACVATGYVAAHGIISQS